MLLGKDLRNVERFSLFNPTCYQYPFPQPWSRLPKVASMEEICDWVYFVLGIGLVPFPRNPGCSPAEMCPMQPVYKDGEAKFLDQLSYGAGLLEGVVEHDRGHMCAWDGEKVYDPRGPLYSFENAGDFDFAATRFWLKVEGKKCRV
jgi:hypothetical protein